MKKENPFAKKCQNCHKNIWIILQQKAEELNSKYSESTYIWIEKFKEDNY